MSRSASVRCILIGIGRRALDDYIPALVDLSPKVDFAGACDVDPGVADQLVEKLRARGHSPVPLFFTDRAVALDQTKPDLAIVATPHHTHLEVVRDLILRDIPILKEKPFAISLAEAHELAHLVDEHDAHLRMCVQRRYHPLYIYAKQVLSEIGEIRHFDASYQLNADAYRVGWRAHPETAGGGAIIDMGYHIVDVLYWFFGIPSVVYATTAPKLIPAASYDIEETVLANLTYAGGTTGTLRLSMCEAAKEEMIRVYGTTGHVKLTRDFFGRFDRSNNMIEQLAGNENWGSAPDVLADTIANLSTPDVAASEATDAVDITATIDALYRSIAEQAPVKPMRQETCSACTSARHRRRTASPRPPHGVPLAEATRRLA